MTTETLVTERPPHMLHSPERRQFSVHCWRWWCDYDFRCRDIASMVSDVTGEPQRLPRLLPARECPTPETCQCECHDAERLPAPVAESDPGA